jgi:NADH-quinone oxidoreductase subunit F
LDLHLSGAEPGAEERAAVDAVLGPPDSPWAGGAQQSDVQGRAALGPEARGEKRHLLLPVLHAIQARFGWIRPGALDYACRRLDVAPAEAFGVASFYGLFSLSPRPGRVVSVCDDIACLTRGAGGLAAELESRLGPAASADLAGRATWVRSPCLGLCERGPAALLTVAGEAPRE